MFNRLLSVRYRRYRPFSRPTKPRAPAVTPAELSTPSQPLAPTIPSVNPEVRVGFSPFQGVKLLQAFEFSASQNPIELSLRLDVDLRKQSVRGVVSLPHGVSREEKLLVFCADSEAEELEKAGADFAGLTENLAKIQKGWLGFDRCIATPAVMPKILPVARILGPKKLMPNPKSGTVVTDLKAAIKEFKSGGSVEFRAEDDGFVKVVIGHTQFSDAQVLDNVKFFVREILKHNKPAEGKKAAASKTFVLEAGLKTAQGPNVNLDVDKIHPNGSGYFR